MNEEDKKYAHTFSFCDPEFVCHGCKLHIDKCTFIPCDPTRSYEDLMYEFYQQMRELNEKANQ